MVTIEKLTLKQARQLAGVSLKDAAKHFGVTARTVSRWESGRGYPTVETFCEICRYYNVSMDDIDLLRPESKL